MRERSRQREPLRLPAGKTCAAAADHGIGSVFHGEHFVLQSDGGKIRHCVLFAAAEDVMAHRIGAELRVVAEIPDGRGDLPRRERGKLFRPEFCRAAVGRFAEKHAPECGLAAGDGTGDADDVAGARRDAQAGEDRLISVGKGEIFERHRFGCRDIQFRELLRLFHQRLDALPGYLRLLHGVEELCGLGGFDRQLRKAGEERSERRNVPGVPSGTENVFCAQPQYEQHARVGHGQIQRRQRRLLHIAAHGGGLAIFQRVLIPLRAGVLAAVDAVGHGVLRAVERGGAERASGLFIRRARALHRLFHPRGAYIGYRRKEQAEQREPPVVHEQHHHIADKRHAGIEDLGGEFPHALHAVVHVGDGFGHQLARALLFERRAALPHQTGVKDALHPAVDVVGKAADIKALDKPRRLHEKRDENIAEHERSHVRGTRIPAENIGETLGEPALVPRPGQKADVVYEPRERHEEQRQPFQPEIGADRVRAEALILILHRRTPSLQRFGNAGIPRGSRSWRPCKAYGAMRRTRRPRPL